MKHVLVVIFAVASACGSSSKKPDPQPVLQGEAPAPVVDPDIPVVTLLDAGAAPRRVLRYAPKEGAGQLLMRMSMVMHVELQQKSPMTITVPEFKVTADTLLADVSASGFTFAWKLTDFSVDPSVDPAMAKALEPELQKMMGLAMTGRMTPRGIVEKADVILPPGADAKLGQTMDSVKQTMRQATTPFPEEAVGVGARWRVVSKVDGEVDLTQTAVFELQSVDGDRGEIALVLDQTAPEQTIATPGVSGKTTLDSLTSTGTGYLKYDLVKVTPAVFNVDLSSDTAMTTASGAGEPTQMRMRIDLAMKMSAKP
jgi:hypothetical protein